MATGLLREIQRRGSAAGLLTAGLVTDALLGVNTATNESLAAAELWAPGFCDYEPSPWTALPLALRPRDITDDAVFLDLGSGKGRVVLQAARLPFRRVIGVELDPALHELAQRNVAAFRGRRRCGEVELVCADATTWPIPDDVTHLYLYNPLIGEPAENLFAEIERSRARRPRAMRVMYLHAEDNAFRSCFPDARRVPARVPRPGLALYELPAV